MPDWRFPVGQYNNKYGGVDLNTDIFTKEYMTAINIYLDILGSPNTDKELGYGFVPGIDDKFLYQKAKSLTLDPQFSICFVGGFAVGKKSLINALIRQDLLITAIRPEYGNWIKTIQYGEENLIILHSDMYSLLNDSLTLSYEEYHKIWEREDIEDFCQKYRYADFYTNNDFLKENRLVIHDISSFYNEGMSLFAGEVMLRSNAFVYCMNAVNPFSNYDIEFLKNQFLIMDMPNSFFVFNGIDRLDFSDDISYSEYVEYIKTKMSELVGGCNKSLDDDWFETRVFFTSTYNAIMSITNRPINTKGQLIRIDDSGTGVTELEKALLDYKKDYTKRIDKVPRKDSIDYHIANLAMIYLASVQRVDEYLINLENECTESNKMELFYQTKKHYLKNIDKLYITLCILFRRIYSQELTDQKLMEMTNNPLFCKGE